MSEVMQSRCIWLISEGSPGHVTQSLGLCEQIGKLRPIRIERVETRFSFGGFVRDLIRRVWFSSRGRALPLWFVKRFLGVTELPVDRPDLVISSGGKSVFAARSLARIFKVPFVFIGERKPYPPGCFDLVFTPSEFENEEVDRRMDLIPTKISQASVEEAAVKWEGRPEGRLWLCLIGGSSRSHHFTDEDWTALARGLHLLAAKHQVRWLVTTSRRTGVQVEKFLRARLDPAIVADAVWWCHEPKKLMEAYLGASEQIFVSQDSISMATEAIASGRGVVLFAPESVDFPKKSFMPGYYDNLEKLGLVRRIAIADLGDTEEVKNSHNSLAERSMGEEVIDHFSW